MSRGNARTHFRLHGIQHHSHDAPCSLKRKQFLLVLYAQGWTSFIALFRETILETYLHDSNAEQIFRLPYEFGRGRDIEASDRARTPPTTKATKVHEGKFWKPRNPCSDAYMQARESLRGGQDHKKTPTSRLEECRRLISRLFG